MIRAADHMVEESAAAIERVAPRGWLIVFVTSGTAERNATNLASITWEAPIPMTGMTDAFLLLGRKPE